MSCETIINEHINWLRLRPRGAGRYSVKLTITTNQAQYSETGGCVVAYATGEVTVPSEPHTPDYLKGDLYESFSDRTFYMPVDDVGTRYPTPFDPFNLDRVGVDLYTNGRVSLMSLTWGGPRQEINLQCDNGVLFGFGPGIGAGAPPAMYIFSLSKHFTA